jgi:Replication-relaxation
MNATPARKSSLILTPRDEEMLRALYDYRYMSARDMAYLLFSPRVLNYVRGRMVRLAGGEDFATNSYLLRFQLPTTTNKGEKIFTLGSKGRDFLQQTGLPVDWYFRPSKPKHFGFSHLTHALLQTRIVVAASYFSRQQQQFKLTQSRLSYDLSRIPALSVIPDAWLVFENQQKYQILLECDRGTQYQVAFKRHIKDRIAFIESGEYVKFFGIKAVMVAYVTTGPRPEYRDSRVATLRRWLQELVTELGMEEWAGLFRVTSVVLGEVYEQGLFEKPVWYRPSSGSPVPLLTP